MKIFLVIFYFVFVQLSYAFESTELYSFSEQVLDCKKECGVDTPNCEEFLKKHIPVMKNFHDSLGMTIQQVLSENPDKTPTSKQVAKIIHDSSNLINTMNTISQSSHLDKISGKDGDICQSLCDSKKFLSTLSNSFIEDTPEDLPVENTFDKKVDSDWYKDGVSNIKKTISILEGQLKLQNCQDDLMAYIPLIQKNYRNFTDAVCRMLKVDNETFTEEASDFIQYIDSMKTLMEKIETDTCLVSNKDVTQFKNIISLVKGLRMYFFDLSNKFNEILEDTKAITDTECYHCNSDAFIQDIIHVIFMYKYNKMYYKQMNNDVSKLLTMIKNLQDSKK